MGNEPNHFKDEWNYSGSEYAHLYNCYYQRWTGREELQNAQGIRQYALYAAGPGQQGPCERVVDHFENGRSVWARDPQEPDEYVYENCSAEGEDITRGYAPFYEGMLINGSETIEYADGFAIHAYGYNTLGTNFEAWLSEGIGDIRTWQTNQGYDDVNIIVTEYNPGANPGLVHPPPTNWEDWFNQTYCWIRAYDEVIGLLYFVDEPDHWRHKAGNNLAWWAVSLRSDQDRRTHWLNVGDQNCEENRMQDPLTDLYASTGDIFFQPKQVSPVQTPTPQPSQFISGVISGTLGQWGKQNVYYVTGDLEVSAGQVLTIAHDTSLVFDSGQGMNIAGQLIAEGDSVGPIRFLSTDEAGWSGLHFLPPSEGSRCIGCYLENIEPRGVALQVEAPITLHQSFIRGVPAGTAISNTVPFTLSNVGIDYVGTGIHLSGPISTTHNITHLTLNRCQQGVVNQGQTLTLDNSILTVCGVAISTELSGTTAVSYSLFHANDEDFVTEAGAQLVQGSGLLTVAPGFVDFPNNIHLLPGSPAVNTADPQADYSREPGYNGGQADMGAYGNTEDATEQPPLEQMGVILEANSPAQGYGWPGQMVTYTLMIRNNGSITDTYKIKVFGAGNRDALFLTSLHQSGSEAPQYILNLEPQEQVSVTIWVRIPLATTSGFSDTISVKAIGKYGIQHQINLTTTVLAFQEQGGQVIMEAEHFAWNAKRSGREWITQTMLAGYTGSSYISALPDTDLQFTITYSSPALYYPINFTTTGTYTVWLRGYTPNAAGDSLYVALDDQPVAIFTGFAPREWDWANSDTFGGIVTFEVTAPGLHTLYLWQREDGLRVDRILLTTDSEYNPSGNGPPENEIK